MGGGKASCGWGNGKKEFAAGPAPGGIPDGHGTGHWQGRQG